MFKRLSQVINGIVVAGLMMFVVDVSIAAQTGEKKASTCIFIKALCKETVNGKHDSAY